MKRIVDPQTGRKRYDLVGERFGRWTVLECTGRAYPQTIWKCQCDCGTIKDGVLYGALVNGGSSSCGCLRSELLKEAVTTHGRSKTKVYRAWQQAKSRCFDKSRRCWKSYGGRGIGMHEPWINDFEAFAAYVDTLGEPPWGAKFDRIDNDKNYEPRNVRWVDDFVSNRNRRGVKFREWKGDIRTLTEIAELENVDYHILRRRIVWPKSDIQIAIDFARKHGKGYVERAKGARPRTEKDAKDI